MVVEECFFSDLQLHSRPQKPHRNCKTIVRQYTMSKTQNCKQNNAKLIILVYKIVSIALDLYVLFIYSIITYVLFIYSIITDEWIINNVFFLPGGFPPGGRVVKPLAPSRCQRTTCISHCCEPPLDDPTQGRANTGVVKPGKTYPPHARSKPVKPHTNANDSM